MFRGSLDSQLTADIVMNGKSDLYQPVISRVRGNTDMVGLQPRSLGLQSGVRQAFLTGAGGGQGVQVGVGGSQPVLSQNKQGG